MNGGHEDGRVLDNGTAVPLAAPVSAMTGMGRVMVKHEAPQAGSLAGADEFGLAVRPARRRPDYSLDELESPEEVRAAVMKEMETFRGNRIDEVEGGRARDEGEEVGPAAMLESEHVPEDGRTLPIPIDTTLTKNAAATAARTSSDHHSSSHATSAPRKPSVSEWSHQQLASKPDLVEEEAEEEQWQDMPALAEHRIYDDWGKVLAKSYAEVPDETLTYSTLGGAGRGYTKVQLDEDAQSATSMDDNTAYLFADPVASNILGEDDDDAQARDLVSQMRTTKELLTEAQRIAYVGVVRLSVRDMEAAMEQLDKSLKGTKRVVEFAAEALRMWGQKMMVRLYRHMEITAQEQVMVEQLAEHGVQPGDLTHVLMQNARVRNPVMKEEDGRRAGASKVAENEAVAMEDGGDDAKGKLADADDVVAAKEGGSKEAEVAEAEAEDGDASPAGVPEAADPQVGRRKEETDQKPDVQRASKPPSIDSRRRDDEETLPPPPPAYEETPATELADDNADSLTNTTTLDLDIRWTVLCDLFLLLIADSTYDARSRTLLERVATALSITWQELCRFEKRVTDAMELQEQAEKENWNEAEHIQQREKAARNKRLMVMGLCTVGGGIIIGLSAGALAPVIGAGLAAGFTGIGIAGTGGFLGGTGAAALIGTTGTLIGGGIGMKTSHRRTGAVRTFEYKPLFNNKRANLIVNVAGWMAGKVDDVRLPFSTVDPIMGDIYSVNWEPEMLQSTGETIQILGTEALTQTIQQILGATFLATLMAGLTLPIVLTKLSYLIDNPWTVSLARADATGLILADSLIDRNLGVRPITLVGFSLGSRVIFSCLKELVKRGALGLVENVYMFGSPVVVKKEEWTRARTVVSGRFVNAYATNDWILAYLFRATSGGLMRVAGLATIPVPGIESIDVTETVPGHMAYRGMMPTLLQEVGWEVENVEFTEIEDPDPEDHARRQRELIGEIEEARRQLDEEQPAEKKTWWGKLSLRGRQKRAAERKGWEMYNEEQTARENRAVVLDGKERDAEELVRANADVMFDVEAIRKEALALALQGTDVEDIKAHLSVREIESTLPALRIESPKIIRASADGIGVDGPAPKVTFTARAAAAAAAPEESTRPKTHDGSMRAHDETADAEDRMRSGMTNGEGEFSMLSRQTNSWKPHSSLEEETDDHYHPKRAESPRDADEGITLSFDADSPVQPQRPTSLHHDDRPKLAPRSQTNDPIADAHQDRADNIHEKAESAPQHPRPSLPTEPASPTDTEVQPALSSAGEPQKEDTRTNPLSNPWAEEDGQDLETEGHVASPGDHVEMSFE